MNERLGDSGYEVKVFITESEIWGAVLEVTIPILYLVLPFGQSPGHRSPTGTVGFAFVRSHAGIADAKSLES